MTETGVGLGVTYRVEILVLGGDGADVFVQPIRPDPLTFQLAFELGEFGRPFSLHIFADFPTRFAQVALVVG